MDWHEFEQQFRQPPVEYQSAPFWFWNDQLDPNNLTFQSDVMQAAGIGAYFMHARTGMQVEYLSRRWMEAIRAVVEHAAACGQQAWLYDEDNWPSGFAGGKVSGRGPDYLQRFLRAQPIKRTEMEKLEPEKAVRMVAAFAVEGDRDTVHDFYRLEGLSKTNGTGWILLCYEELFSQEAAQEAHITNGYVDTMNPQVTRAFLEETHERYRDWVGEHFGGAVPGIFTDEPSIRAHELWNAVPKVPWTPELPSVFESRRGYDLLEQLPSLFYPVGAYHKVRYDFYRTLMELFVENFTRPIAEWCHEHRLQLTGHFLLETPLRMQVQCLSAVMPHYEWMHCPGIDHLGRAIAQDGHPDMTVLLKQVASVADQLGKDRVISEMFGCGGYDLGPREQKRIAAWHFALGVNWVCQHAFYESPRGLRKREYPPDCFYRQPWWPYARPLHDFFARLALALRQGEREVDLLVLSPIATLWVTHQPQDLPWQGGEAADWEPRFNALCHRLTCARRDYHIGDEFILARHGRVEGGELRVARAHYRTVIVPPALTLKRTTVALLQEWLAAGGQVVALEPVASEIEGEPAPELAAVWEQAVIIGGNPEEQVSALLNWLEHHQPRTFRLDVQVAEADPDVLIHARRLRDRRLFFIANLSVSRQTEARLLVPEVGAWRSWDPTTGEVREQAASVSSDGSAAELELAACEVRLLEFCPQAASPRARPPVPEVLLSLAGPWRAERLSPNVLVLDQGRLGIDGQRWSERIPVFKARRLLLEEYQRRGAPVPARWRMEFDMALEPGNWPGGPPALAYALETPDRFRVTCNDQELDFQGGNCYLDPAFPLAPLPPLQRATNTLEWEMEFTPDLELENSYVVGDFAVGWDGYDRFWVQPEEGVLVAHPWMSQGYPFYAGAIRYHVEAELPEWQGRLWVHVGAVRHGMKVWCNDREMGTCLWEPYRVEITAAARPGRNQLVLEVFNSLRNLFGPHHLRGEEQRTTFDPGCYVSEADWEERYRFAPCGILSGVEIWGTAESV